MTNVEFQMATEADRTVLRSMQAHSMRKLGAAFYSGHAIEAFISQIGTMDDYLIEDGTYLIATCGGILVGSGGWSTRQATYDTCNASRATNPNKADATVRSVYVHPAWARRGIGGLIMKRIEADILSAGYLNSVLTATLSGVPLYRHLGYHASRKVALALPGDITFGALKMQKFLGIAGHHRPAA